MKCQVLPACLLLLWTLTASVSAQEEPPEFVVKTVSDGIELVCGDNDIIRTKDDKSVKSTKLHYKDENTGEYMCDNPGEAKSKIFVKFRTCENCIEVDATAITGLVVGEVMATVVIGVAVYLIASQFRSSPFTPQKKSSDRQHLVPNEVSNRAPNDHYQPLRHKGGHKETYDVLSNRR
ncbi:T-cell surface glycoprotein CD3 gamma chain-like [Enoplosus armatus]|uniref:T-cell surface glycoprotein CD3 gamma chain-like n=1 Tax=Enoplosus armatus TaxID=215367 RepID=UPI0039946D88